MSTHTTNKSMILSGTPFAWIHKIAATGAPAIKYKFDNLQSATYKLIRPSSDAAASGENLDINRADGGIIRFPKTSLIIDGKDESDITPASASSEATNKGEITLVINEAPVGMSWTQFIKDLKTEFSSLFCVTIGTGFTYDSRNTQKKADGWLYMFAKLNNDIEQQLNNGATSLTLTFASYLCTYSDVAVTPANVEAMAFAALKHKPSADTYQAASLASGDGAILKSGDIVIKTDASYTYV